MESPMLELRDRRRSSYSLTLHGNIWNQIRLRKLYIDVDYAFSDANRMLYEEEVSRSAMKD